MKQTIIFSTILILTLAFNGCGGGKSNNSSNDTQTPNNPYSYGYSCEGDITVNGYTLPPCPDPKINDSTLLGIDSNNNGVRDDVERWLIVKYKNHHKIVTEIGFQAGKAHQFMLANPDKPEESRQKINGAQACNFYFQSYADINNEPILINHDIMTDKRGFKAVSLNTKARIRAFLAYDKKLSGGVYNFPDIYKQRAFCAFNVDKLLGK